MTTSKPKALGACLLIAVSLAAPVCAQTEPATRHTVVHIEVLGVDAPRLQGFYRDLFGWAVTLNQVGYGYVPIAPAASAPLTGGVGPSPQRQPGTLATPSTSAPCQNQRPFCCCWRVFPWSAASQHGAVVKPLRSSEAPSQRNVHTARGKVRA